MSDRELRAAERDWLNDPEDDALLRRFVGELLRHGRDPVYGLADAAPDAPWAGFLDASVEIHNVSSGHVGRRLFAFVHNDTFSHSKIDIFGPDAIDVWGRTDRAGLLRVRPEVAVRPESGEIRIHNLGGGEIAEHAWRATQADFARAVDLVLVALAHQPQVPMATWQADPVRRTGSELIEGSSCPVLAPEGDALVLQPLLVWADGQAQLGPRGALRPFDDFAALLVGEGGVTTAPPPDAWIRLPGLGRVRLTGSEYWSWFVDPGERARELADELDQLQGGPGALQACRNALVEYQANADDAFARNQARESLRIAYEAIPEHLRMYVGSMDTKDYEVRRILYPEPFED